MANARPCHGSSKTGSPSTAGQAASPPSSVAARDRSSDCTARRYADQTAPMDSFAGKIAVVTGGGTGMGRELVRQLAAEGCSVAMCDVSATNMADTALLARGRRAGRRRRVVVRGRRVGRVAARGLPRARVGRARHRAHRPAVQQRRHRRWGQPGARSARRVGAGLRRLLGRRLPRHAHVPPDAAGAAPTVMS